MFCPSFFIYTTQQNKMSEHRDNLTLYETLHNTVSWEECPNKEFLEQSWKSIAGQLSSFQREDEIVRLKKIIWQLEQSLAREAQEKKAIEDRIEQCAPSIRSFLLKK